MVQRLRRWLLPAIVCAGAIGCGGNGTDTSSPSSPQAPTITAQPQDVNVMTGAAASFNVTATGDATLAYQWRRNGSTIAGATAAAYSFAAVAKTDDGAEFSVVVTNSAGSATSRAAKLTVTDPAAAITTSPQSASTTAGQTATFTVAATGTGTLTYQWLRDGADIAGATAASYTTAALTLADNGAKFSVRVTDANASSATSAEAVLTVTAVPASTVRLSAGTDYTLVRRTDGSVLMLGSNSGVSLAPATALAGTNARAVTGTVGIDVSAGDLYALAVSADGKLWGWGHSGGGRLGGNAFNENVTTPREVPGVDQVRSALAAMTYSLALRSDGSVWHWPGVVSVASSGVATITPRSIAGLTDVVRLTGGHSGGFSPLALRSDGTVWELSWTPQVVMGPTGPVTTHTGSARQLTGLSQVSDVACSSHCLALKTNGSVVAWGRNAEGQLGSGRPSTTPVASDAPVTVSGLSQVVAVGAQGNGSVALTQDGRVWTWGATHGQGNASELVVPTELVGLNGATALSCSSSQCALLLGDGSLWGWGSGGPLAGSTPRQATGLKLAASGINVTAGPQPALASVGQTATFSVLATGSGGAAPSYQWLRNGASIAGATGASYSTAALILADDGAQYSVRIGDTTGTLTTRSAALSVTTTPTTSAVPGRVMGERLYRYSDAAGSTTSWRWGDGSADSIGSPVSKVWRLPGDFTAQRNSTAFRVIAIGSALAHGEDHSCALKADQSVACWGSNGRGELGDGTVVDRLVPASVPGLTGVVSLAAGTQTTCALKSDGSVWCWGRNDVGQLGNGTLLDKTAPTQVSGLSDVTALAVGNFHACALQRSGAVRCWGSNTYGTLGDGSSASNRSSPVAVSGLSDAVAISAGSGTCAVRRSGQVSCWGSLTLASGASGFGGSVPSVVSGLDNAVSLSFGTSHVCALRADQRVLCWGINTNGQIGDGSATSRTTPSLVSGLSDALQVTTGGSHSCALRVGGVVSCWGYSGVGAVGDGADGEIQPVNILTPRDVRGLSSSTAVQAKGSRSCALTAEGRAICWGQGLLGAGTSARNYAPIAVQGGTSYWK